MRKVVGLDISLKKIAVCVLDRDGQPEWQGNVDAEPGPLAEKLRLWRDEIDLVGLEACPLSEWLHRHLIADGFNAVCVETRQAQRFLSTRPVKTDRKRKTSTSLSTTPASGRARSADVNYMSVGLVTRSSPDL